MDVLPIFDNIPIYKDAHPWAYNTRWFYANSKYTHS